MKKRRRKKKTLKKKRMRIPCLPVSQLEFEGVSASFVSMRMILGNIYCTASS
jgi:hypothetical protein